MTLPAVVPPELDVDGQPVGTCHESGPADERPSGADLPRSPDGLLEEFVIEEVPIDGICGVY